MAKLHQAGPQLAGVVFSGGKLDTNTLESIYYQMARECDTALTALARSLRTEINQEQRHKLGLTDCPPASEQCLREILPIDKILFYFHAENSYDFAELNTQSPSLLQGGILEQEQVSSRTDVLLSSAMGQATSNAYLVGRAVVLRARSLGDAFRRSGGIQYLLSAISRANETGTLHAALSLLCLVLQRNPKNFRTLEKLNAYQILAHHLKSIEREAQRRDAHVIDESIVDLLFTLAGLTDQCTSGILTNTGFLEDVLLDYDLWTLCSRQTVIVLFQRLINAIKANLEKETNIFRLNEVTSDRLHF